jgi:hypothetical protein
MKCTSVGVLGLLAVGASAAVQRLGPTWSEVTGNLYSRTQMNRTAATIKQIDGKHETARIVKVEPGRHEVVVASPMRNGFAGSDASLQIEFEPCRRYYVNSQFKAGRGTDWEPVLAMVEAIAGCKTPAK